MKSNIMARKQGQNKVRGPITPLSFFFCFSEDALDIVEEVESKFYLLQNIFEKRYSIIYKDWRIKGTLCEENTQSVYDKIIRACNYAIFIFKDEIRDGAKSEFEMVYNHLANNGRKPKILLYINNNGESTEALRNHFKTYSKHITYILFNNSSQIFEDIMLKVITQYFKESIRYYHIKPGSRSKLIKNRLQILQHEYKSIFAKYPQEITLIENAMKQTYRKKNAVKIINFKHQPMNMGKASTIKTVNTILH